MGSKLKISTGIFFISLCPMLGHYIQDSVGASAFTLGISILVWGIVDEIHKG